MKLHDTLLGLIFVALGGALVVMSYSFPTPRHLDYGPGVFPRLMGGGLSLSGLGIAAFGLSEKAALVRLPDWTTDRRRALNVIAIPLAALVYYAVSGLLGFTLTALVILSALLMIGGVRPLRAALVAVCVSLVTTLLFASILHVPLPWGLLTPVSGWFIW